METTQKGFSVKIPPFTGESPEKFEEWSYQFQAVLDAAGLLETLFEPNPADAEATAAVTTTTEGEVPGEAEAKKAAKDWKDKDKSIFFKLILCTSDKAGSIVRQFAAETEAGRGQRAWQALRNKYEHTGKTGRVELQKEFMTATMGPGDDPDVFIGYMEGIVRKLEVLKLSTSEETLQTTILSKLPSNYETLVTLLEADEGLSYTAMKERIRTFYKRSVRGAYAAEDAAKALAVEEAKEKGLCFGCGLPGHVIADCRRIGAQNKKAGGGRGNPNKHPGGGGGRNKPRGGGRGGGGFGNNHKKPAGGGGRKPPSNKEDIICYRCDGKGHKVWQCPERKEAQANAATTYGGRGDESTMALIAASGQHSNCCGKKQAKGALAWVVDSGCTSHMVSSDKGLTDVRWGKGRVIVAGGKTLDSVGVGRINATIKTHQGISKLVTFEEVLLVPGLGRNLLSVKKVVTRGGKVTFTPSHAVIETSNGVRMPLRQAGDLYELECQLATGIAVETQAALLTAMEVAWLWHEKTCHRNPDDVQQLGKMGVGVPRNIMRIDTSQCSTCQRGKGKRISFPRSLERRATKPLEVVHMDVCGPIDTESLMGKSRYMVTFTDDYTKYRKVYFMVFKSETLEKFKLYLADMNVLVQGKYKIMGVHSDNGGEFTSRAFERYCKRKGILQTYTGPYAPEQNGVAERSNRTVVEMARCLRIHSGMEKAIWAEACNTAVYILNRVPTSGLGGDTPFKRLLGRQAKMGHLKVFGCMAYVHLQERKKLDDKVWMGIMVGYDEHNTRCYRIYDPVRRTVVRSVHVSFNERVFPAKANDVPAIPDVAADDEPPKGPEEQEPAVGGPAERVGQPKDQSKVPLRLLPLGSNLLRGQQQERREQPPGDELDMNDENLLDDQERDADSVGDHEDPYRRDTYRPSTRESRWCHDEECDIPGTHKAHLGIHFAYAAAEDVFGEDPQSYKEAMSSPDAPRWKGAMKEEHTSLKINDTWTLVTLPPGANVVGTVWKYKTKRDQYGKLVKSKARLCAQGFKQKPGVDYLPDHTSAPVARVTSIRSVLSIAAREDWHLHNMDVDSAFLNAEIKEEIYLKQPQGFEEWGPNGEELVCRLNKSIYGLKQAARDWNDTLDEWMRGYGFKASISDPCMYVMRTDQDILIALVWVDDIILAGNSMEGIADFKAAISKRFKMKDLGELKFILGVEVKRDRARRRIEITQEAYINQMLERFGMSKCKAVATPAEGVLSRISAEEGGIVDRNYMCVVGSLLYASMVTRPDITYAVQALGRHLQSSGAEHMVAAKRVLRYLQGTKNIGIVYQGRADTTDVSLVGYSDSDWGGDKDTRRSTTGYLFMLDTGVVSWSSKLQPTVALSSAEAEYMAACAAVQEAIHLRQFLEDLGFPQVGATVIFEDNQGCIALSDNPVFHKRSKHIDIRYHFIRERAASGEIKLRYVATEHQLADLLTKGLAGPRTIALRSRIMGYVGN